MKIIEFYSAHDKSHWLEKIGESDWRAGKYLYELLKTEKLKTHVGESAELLMLTEGKELISFCALAEKDEIPTDLTPWIGFVYTFPNYRGKRHAGRLLGHAERLAKKPAQRMSTFPPTTSACMRNTATSFSKWRKPKMAVIQEFMSSGCKIISAVSTSHFFKKG